MEEAKEVSAVIRAAAAAAADFAGTTSLHSGRMSGKIMPLEGTVFSWPL